MAARYPPGTGGNRLGFTLGAVGGQRGTGAGISRQVLIDFITRYDRGQLEKLAGDLQKLNATAIENAQQIANVSQHQAQLETLVNQAKTARNKLDAAGLGALKAIQETQTQIRSEAQKAGGVQAETLAQLNAQKAALISTKQISAAQLDLVLNEKNIRGQMAATAQRMQGELQNQLLLDEQINAVEAERNGIMQKAYSSLSGIKGLLVGAVGGIIGGAVIGALLFTPLQGVIDALTNQLKDIIDPAAKARDALKDVADQVAAIASKDNLTNLEAAQKLIGNLGGLGGPAGITAGPLADAAKTQALKDLLDNIEKFQQQGKSSEILWNEQRTRGVQILATQSDAYKALLGNIQQRVAAEESLAGASLFTAANIDHLLQSGIVTVEQANALKTALIDAAAALGVAADGAGTVADQLQKAKDAAAAVREELLRASVADIGTASLDALQSELNSAVNIAQETYGRIINAINSVADAQISAVQAGADAAINGLQARISALRLVPSARTTGLEKAIADLSSAGPSERTKALADQIDRINRATERLTYLANLAAVAQQRHDLVLAHSLSLQETRINVLKYHGQDRVIAIDAELARLQKRNAEQQKFNQLLDIEYQYQQGVKRTVGESVTDFIQRRAQFYRGLINQTAVLNQQSATDTLTKQKADAEYEIKLKALTEQRKQIIADRAHALFMKRLQTELQASQAADQAALAARRKALEAQLAASKAADQATLDSKRRALQAQIDAVRAGSKSEIDAINKQRDSNIKAAQDARDATIQAAKDGIAAQVKAQEKLNKDLADLAQQQWVDQRVAALKGTDNLTEIERAAGRYGGSEYAYNLLLGQISGLGLPTDQMNALLLHADQVRAAYLAALQGLKYYGGGRPGYAGGGIFPLTNGMNFGDNMRVGEQGPELGVVLSNKVVEALHHNDKGRSPLFGGGMTINTGEDPYRARALWERRMREVVREELRH